MRSLKLTQSQISDFKTQATYSLRGTILFILSCDNKTDWWENHYKKDRLLIKSQSILNMLAQLTGWQSYSELKIKGIISRAEISGPIYLADFLIPSSLWPGIINHYRPKSFKEDAWFSAVNEALERLPKSNDALQEELRLDSKFAENPWMVHMIRHLPCAIGFHINLESKPNEFALKYASGTLPEWEELSEEDDYDELFMDTPLLTPIFNSFYEIEQHVAQNYEKYRKFIYDNSPNRKVFWKTGSDQHKLYEVCKDILKNTSILIVPDCPGDYHDSFEAILIDLQDQKIEDGNTNLSSDDDVLFMFWTSEDEKDAFDKQGSFLDQVTDDMEFLLDQNPAYKEFPLEAVRLALDSFPLFLTHIISVEYDAFDLVRPYFQKHGFDIVWDGEDTNPIYIIKNIGIGGICGTLSPWTCDGIREAYRVFRKSKSSIPDN